MLAKVLSSAVIGIDARLVEVEIDISHGLPAFTTVGLAETAVKESKERVKSAITNSGYAFPHDRITINLAPADVKKEGTGFDLPIALGILSATGLISQEIISRYLIMGELSLDGRIKPVKGSLPMALAAKKANYSGIMIPWENRKEAAVVKGIAVIPVRNLYQTVDFFQGTNTIAPETIEPALAEDKETPSEMNFSEVVGQEHAKRALEIAAAGGHNLIMTGPPGSGKTMLARRLPSILPPLHFDEAIETTTIYSVTGALGRGQSLITERPFRSPHHTISDAGLIGGGHTPKPGEVSLAHNGVLFLDELPEFKKHVLEVLRQPLEDRQVTISRSLTTITFPSSFMLIAAMNPCPCGFFSDARHRCKCTHHQIANYRARISGPLLDRIDIQIEVPAVPYKNLIHQKPAEPSEVIRSRVIKARDIQKNRYQPSKIYSNSRMGSKLIQQHCRIKPDSEKLLMKAIDKLKLSARAYYRILKIARTIADLDDQTGIQTNHIAEAIQYRSLERGNCF